MPRKTKSVKARPKVVLGGKPRKNSKCIGGIHVALTYEGQFMQKIKRLSAALAKAKAAADALTFTKKDMAATPVKLRPKAK